MADKITDIIDQSAFKQVEDLTKNLKDLNDLMVKTIDNSLKLNNSVGNASGIVNVSNAINNQATALKKVTEVQTQFVQTDLQLKQAEEELSNSLRKSSDALNERQKAELEAQMSAREWAKANATVVQSNEKVGKSVDDLRREKLGQKLATQDMANAEKQLVAVEISVANSMEKARKQNILLRAERDQLDLTTKAGSERQKILNKLIDDNTAFLKKNGDAQQKQAMNIGNYTGSLKVVWGALRQIAYILPGIGIAGIFNLAGEAIVALIDKMGLLNDETKQYKETLLKGAQGSVSEVNELERLYESTQDVTLSINERKLAIDKLQEIYPTYFGNIQDEKILNGEATATYYHLRDAIVASARAKAIKTKIDEIVSDGMETELDLIEAQAQAIEKYNKNKGKFIRVGAGSIFGSGIETDETRLKDIQNAEKNLSDFYKNQNKELKKYQDNLKETDKVIAKYGDPYAKAPKEPKTPKPKAEPKEAEVNRINDIKKQYEREQKELETSFKNKTITEEEFYYQSIQKATKFIEERIGLSKKEHETEIDFNLDLRAKAQDFHDKLINNSLKELQVYQYVYGKQEEIVKAKQDAIKKKYKETYDGLNEQQKKNQKLLEDIQEKQNKKLEDYYSLQKARQELTDASIEASAEIASTITDRLIYNAERLAEIELNRVDAQEKAELASLDRLTLSENERAEKKKQIELEAEARRKAIEKEKIKDLRKFALIQKGIDVAEIISATALAIMRQLGNAVDQANGSAIPKAIAIGLTGAVQLAKVLATPLPQYAEGIESTPTDSFAIVGEKGTELITEKSGKQYLTPNRDTLTYLPKGTKVTPHHELMANVYDNAHKYMASNSSVTTDTMQTALIQSFEELYNKVDNLTEIMAKKNMNVSIFGDFEHAMRIKKSRM